MTMSATLLSTLLQDVATVPAQSDCLVTHITQDSRAVGEGSLFVALSGGQVHGLDYAKQAMQQGASAILAELDDDKPLPALGIPVIGLPDLRKKLGKIADRFYQSPSQKLNVVGITGTDGKTSVSHFMAQAINNSAVIGTIGIGAVDNLEQATHTTPDVINVHKTLAEMVQQGIKTVAMEVSSHALDQGRVEGVAFDVAVLTNLSRDHLDYHKTLPAYAAAKAKLFSWQGLDALVINLDDEFGQQIAADFSSKRVKSGGGVLIGYGIGHKNDYPEGSLIAQNVQLTQQGLSADISYAGQTGKLEAAVLGRFNLSNLLASLGSMLALGFPLDDALTQLNQVHTVSGRMEKVPGASFLTVVDYAHTPNALETVLSALREHTRNKLICVFGCGGDRDTGKRPLMAAVAEQQADVVIVTDDNPRTESPQKIMQDIVAGFTNPAAVIIEHDRAKAIKIALQQAQQGDAVLIAGKGHENVQILASGCQSFSDREQASKVLQELAA